MADSPARDQIKIGELILDKSRFQVLVEGTPTTLTRKEFALLWALATEPDRVFHRQELLNTAWDENVSVELRTIDAHIVRLRRKLKSAAKTVPSIETVWGIGYRLKKPEDPFPFHTSGSEQLAHSAVDSTAHATYRCQSRT